jgi:hypothetical protein
VEELPATIFEDDLCLCLHCLLAAAESDYECLRTSTTSPTISMLGIGVSLWITNMVSTTSSKRISARRSRILEEGMDRCLETPEVVLLLQWTWMKTTYVV